MPSSRIHTPADVVASVKAQPDRRCASDPLPTWLLKKCVGVISPFLCQLFNSGRLSTARLGHIEFQMRLHYAAVKESRYRSGQR